MNIHKNNKYVGGGRLINTINKNHSLYIIKSKSFSLQEPFICQ